MTDFLAGTDLVQHVKALADDIGPRPAGHPEERAALIYCRSQLESYGLSDLEEIPFPAANTWFYALAVPLLIGLGTNLPGRRGPLHNLLGGGIGLAASYAILEGTKCNRQPFQRLHPRRESQTLVARIPPSGEKRQTIVLLGHLDTNKHRLTFAPPLKKTLQLTVTAGLLTLVGNALAQLGAAVGVKGMSRLRNLSALGIGAALAVLLADESGGYIDGANDNATAVACLLGIGAQLAQEPLKHTEVWLAFTGAEEVGGLGAHALLDKHGETLRDAYFLDFEMVGAGDIAYTTRHSGLSYFSAYRPDPDSIALAEETCRQHPEYGVRGQEMVIVEEIGALRGRGYRGLCLVGTGQDGWLVNWHRYTDASENIETLPLETAARYGWAMMQILDERDV
ncbi:M28 family peptidase [Chloroflexota bacterium]